MTAKLHAILSTILLLLAFALYQCEATVSSGIDATIGKEDAVIITSPIDRSTMGENDGMMDAVRYLKEGEEANVHKRKESPYFNIRVPFALVACIIVYTFTFVGLLLVIPFLMCERWHFFKSAFWVADSHLQYSAETTEQRTKFGSSTIKSKVDMNAKEQTAKLLADISVPSVACGAILATTLFLVIPESILQIQRATSSDEGEIEILSGTISRFGAALMLGFMLHLVLGAMFPSSTDNVRSDESVSSSDLESTSVHETIQPSNVIYDEEKNDEDGHSDVSEQEFKESTFESNIKRNITDTNSDKSSNRPTEGASNDRNHNFLNMFNIARLSISVLYDDATHGIFDGIFIGCAFMTCSNATAVYITIITIYIEMSRKVASYFLLTECGQVSPTRAALFIFASGFAVIVGVSIILASTVYIGELTIGIFLAIASGIYLHISATECISRIYSVVKTPRDRLFTVSFFVVGALPIGFSFLNHGHCDM